MSLISRVIDKAYVQRAEAQIRDEHDQWMRTAKLDTPYWTLEPIFPAQSDKGWTYDIHLGPIIFTKRWTFGCHGLDAGTSTSWRIWRQHGPLTLVPQQTTASWHQRHAGAHAAEMQRMARAVDAAVIAELRRRYPHSTRALATA